MVRATEIPLANILPLTAGVTDAGHLTLGGCDAVELAREFGTPLYVFDEETLRGQCRAFQEAFQSRYHNSIVAYAAKAYLGRAMAGIIAQEGMSLDVVSGGELAVAASVGFPAERIHFHGNNKSEQELREALDDGIARIVVDNFHELQLLNGIAQGRGARQKILLRLSPGIDPHTHAKTTTGTLDNKFGLPMPTGQAEAAVRQALDMPGRRARRAARAPRLAGLRAGAVRRGVDTVLEFAARMKKAYGFEMRSSAPAAASRSPTRPTSTRPSPPSTPRRSTRRCANRCWRHELPAPQLIVEPGRSIVARAAVALYTVGSLEGGARRQRFVSVDGGMADNIRPAMYEARYEALVANRAHDERRETVTVAGKYCESGDVLMKDAELPPLEAGDVLAMPAAGAYALAMASNYNLSLRPPVVLVRDGEAKLMRRRETYEDLTRADVWPLE